MTSYNVESRSTSVMSNQTTLCKTKAKQYEAKLLQQILWILEQQMNDKEVFPQVMVH